MKLSTKSIIFLLILFVFVGLGLWIGMFFFLKTDTQRAGRSINEIIDRYDATEEKNEASWIAEEINSKKEALDALLSYLNDQKIPTERQALEAFVNQLIGYHPDISFVQASVKGDDTYGVLSHDIYLCDAIYVSTSQEKALFKVQLDGKQEYLIGKKVNPKMYALYVIEDTPTFDKAKSLLENKALSNHCEQGQFSWSKLIEMVQALGRSSDSNEKVMGMFYGENNEGVMLSKEKVFRYLPVKKATDAIDLFYDEKYTPASYLYRQLEQDGLVITIGSALDYLFHFFSKISGSNLLVVPEGKKPIIYTPQKEKLFESQIDLHFEKNEKKAFDYEGHTYHITKLEVKGIHQTQFYALYRMIPLEKKTAIKRRLETLSTHLIHQISLHIVLVTIGLLFLALLVATKAIKQVVTLPLSSLGKAAVEITKGNFSAPMPEKGASLEIDELIQAFSEMKQGLHDKEKIRGVLNKVVSKDIAEEILKTSLHLGGETKEVTILFSDIRNFTSKTRDLSPQDTIAFLNEYMTKMSQIIEGEGGIIDKYVGDEIMALYGVPKLVPDHTVKAVASGLLMKQVLDKWNQERAKENKDSIEVGIGIHTGLVVAGNMGATDRLNYTVIGANVNLAARLCEYSKNNEVLVSEATWNQEGIQQAFKGELLKNEVLRGFEKPINIYKVTDFKWEH